MQKLWQRFYNLVNGDVPNLRPKKLREESHFQVGIIDIPKTIEQGEWFVPAYRGAEKRIKAHLQKEGEVQKDKGLLSRHVAGVDPYDESGELRINIFRFGGELSPHPSEGNLPELGYSAQEHNNSNLGRAHKVRRASYEPQVRRIRKRDAKYMGDRLAATGLAILYGRGVGKTAAFLEALSKLKK